MAITGSYSVLLFVYQSVMILLLVLAILFFIYVFKVLRKLNKFLDKKLDETEVS